MRVVHCLARCAGLLSTIGLLAISAIGCSDPVTPPPQGAFQATFSGTTCAATVSPGPTINIGTATAGESATLADGTDNLHVSCKVIPSGDGFYTYLRISKGTYLMSFESTLPADAAKTSDAKVYVSGPNTSGSAYKPTSTGNCTAKFIDGAAGRIKASFSCTDTWNSVGQTTATCFIDGYVVGENCDQE